jgi:hypothetical protein
VVLVARVAYSQYLKPENKYPKTDQNINSTSKALYQVLPS